MAGQPLWKQLAPGAAEAYARVLAPAMFAPWAPRLVALAGLGPGDRVLDVACGTGVVARAAADRVGPAGRVVGVDASPAMLAAARALPPPAGAPIAWAKGDALALPFPPARFHAVLCSHGLQQFPDRAAALAEMRRVLAPGGRLAAAVWAGLGDNPGMAALVAALERHVGPEAAANRRVPFALADAAALEGLVAGAGFRAAAVRTEVETARFADPESFVAGQMAATPLALVGGLTDEVRAAVARDVRAALAPFLAADRALAAPMAAHLVLARA